MYQPTEHRHISGEELTALIDESLGVCRKLPPRERLAKLNEQLRTELARLTPAVQAQADGMNRGTTDWYGRRRAVDATRNALADDLSGNPLAASMAVAELGRRLNELSNYVTGGGQS
ncbi:DUF6415 family natural product biosynthesis protein [Streptomyces sp. NPDC055239]